VKHGPHKVGWLSGYAVTGARFVEERVLIREHLEAATIAAKSCSAIANFPCCYRACPENCRRDLAVRFRVAPRKPFPLKIFSQPHAQKFAIARNSCSTMFFRPLTVRLRRIFLAILVFVLVFSLCSGITVRAVPNDVR